MYQQLGERNFHSFYNLLLGASESELREFGLKLSDASNYNYIKQGGTQVGNNINDKQNYKSVNDAMKIACFDQQLIKTIWSIIASIIHLGNIKFEPNETDLNNNRNSGQQQTKINKETLKSVKEIAKLLKIDENNLIEALTSRIIATGHKDIVKTFLSVQEAIYARDSLAKVRS